MPNSQMHSHLDFKNVVGVVRQGRLRYFGHLECKNADDSVLGYGNIVLYCIVLWTLY